MESLGEKLKTAREERGWSYDYVSRETNISSRYLEALERENFSPFPSEPYIIGYIRSYGDYLDLNSGELLALYRSLRMQEQPLPVEQLLKNPSPLPKILRALAVFLAIFALAGAAFLIISNFIRRNPAQIPMVRTAVEYTLSTDFLERRFYPGDSILVSGGADMYKLVFSSLSDAVTISTPMGSVMLDLGQEVTVDLTNDGLHSVRIIASDFARNDSVSGALLRFEQFPSAAAHASSPWDIGFGRELLLLSSPNPFPFTLQAVFQGFCLFRYEILFEAARPGQNERFYQRFEEINIQAQNGIRLGVSNAQAVRFQVVGGGRTIPFEAGSAGEVIAAELRWLRDEDNSFRLVFMRLD
ncbi:MAG: helix-turn-helix domain-containing protein [Treponema sp.]|nr:helix-turn-helix domain-containing protein [Treponema sp.]